MESKRIPNVAVEQGFPVITTDGQGKRHLLGMGVVSPFDGGISFNFDDTSRDSYVKTIISAITRGLISALTITPTQPLHESEMERE